jgi:hypothetical protein
MALYLPTNVTHYRKTLGKGLLLKILRDADLTKEQLIDLLA